LSPDGKILFNGRDPENLWLSPFSPYHTYYANNKRDVMYKVWSSVVYGASKEELELGIYRNSRAKFSWHERIEILDEILRNTIHLHPILTALLLDTNNHELIYQISNNESLDKKWLGYNPQNGEGENNLGKAWMKIRDELIS
jgi:predicted NAD-dependent protein-ADP-ribosyltransferase YbiA (DUF1768 family)